MPLVIRRFGRRDRGDTERAEVVEPPVQDGFVVDTRRGEGRLEVRPDCLIIDLPDLLVEPWELLEPWELDRADVVEVDWWSATRAVFGGTTRPHGPELARSRAVRVVPRWARSSNLAIWTRSPIPFGTTWRPGRFARRSRWRGWDVVEAPPLPPGAQPIAGLYLTVLAHPLALKRSLERWGVVFPTGGQ